VLARDRSGARRSVVPEAAGRSLWLAAAWTGAGTAIVAAITAIAVVAVCWLPASGGSGNAASAIRAGVLTFLAALHGGITVDGLPSAFVPLGMTLAVAALAWRAGSGLADAADLLGEHRRAQLAQAAALQTLTFAACCGVSAHLAGLGSSRVSALAATLAGLVLFAGFGGVAFVRASDLREDVVAVLPDWLGPACRAAAAAVGCYVAAGAALTAAALVVHHERVEALSHLVGGGWSGVPVLLLGVLAAPNAAIAGAAYLSGAGFALGSGSPVALGSTVHGTLPAFPVLGAVPVGPAPVPVWLLAGLVPLVAGGCVARVALAGGAAGWRPALRTAGVAAAVVGLAAMVLAWQGGGAVGSGRLSAFGASPWKFAVATGGAVGVVGASFTGALLALSWWRDVRERRELARPVLVAVEVEDEPDAEPDDDAEAGILAG
jgi:hypothetical protein